MKIVFTANGRCASAVVEPAGQPITAGSRGVPAEIHLSPDYDGLVVTAFFRSEYGAWPVVLGETPGTVTIPWEAMEKKSLTFDVGVVGKNGDGAIVIPTIWARAGKIVPATEDSGLEPGDPSADIGAQIVEQARDAAKKAEDAAEQAEEAIGYMPKIVDGTWWVYDAETETWADTGIQAEGFCIVDYVPSVDDLPTSAPPGAGYGVGTEPPFSIYFYTESDGWVNNGTLQGPAGVSPTVAVTDITGGHRVTITDAAGSSSFDVMDGTDGSPGTPGVSPTVTVTDITGGHRVTITDAAGSSIFDVMDGADGSPGVSPTVTVTDITGGHRVTITDATGSQSFDVMDGAGGGTTNYNELSNRPRINGVTLSDNKTSADLGISSPTVYHFFYNNGYLSCSEISPVNFVRMSPETNNFQVVCYSDVYSDTNIVTYTSWTFGGIVFGDDYYQIQFFVSYLTEDASVRTAVMYVLYNPSTDSGKSWNQLFVNIIESY